MSPHESRFLPSTRDVPTCALSVVVKTGGCVSVGSRAKSADTSSSASSTLSNRTERPFAGCSSLAHPREDASVEVVAKLHLCESRRNVPAEHEEREVAVLERVEQVAVE